MVDVRPGDELRCEYLAGISLMQGRDARQAHLKRVWGFACSCERCRWRGPGRSSENDPMDVPSSRAWEANAELIMGYVKKGSDDTDKALHYLIKKQRARRS